MPAARSLKEGALPIGLAHKVPLKNDVAAGAIVRWSDVDIDPEVQAVKIRREAEAMVQRSLVPAQPHARSRAGRGVSKLLRWWPPVRTHVAMPSDEGGSTGIATAACALLPFLRPLRGLLCRRLLRSFCRPFFFAALRQSSFVASREPFDQRIELGPGQFRMDLAALRDRSRCRR